MYMPKGSLLSWIDPITPGVVNSITEHNREPVSVTVNRIEKRTRMANGTMRTWVIADKKTWSVTWSNLPHLAVNCVDGKWGGTEMETFYAAHSGNFTLQVKTTGVISTYNVVFNTFDKTIVKRGTYDLWTLSVVIEEV